LPQYVALLGSINVGGNRLKMAELKAALAVEGFRKVATVVASGNVLFEHDSAPDRKLEEQIAEIVRARFGIETFAVVRSKAELEAAVEDNPFVESSEPEIRAHDLSAGTARPRGVRRFCPRLCRP
jgi:uncharacterized protein (DUF1697 family)